MVKGKFIGDAMARTGRAARKFVPHKYVVERVKLRGKRSAKGLNLYAVYGHKRR